MNHPKKERSSSGTNSDPTGEEFSNDMMTLFSVVECDTHGYHIVMWSATLDPDEE